MSGFVTTHRRGWIDIWLDAAYEHFVTLEDGEGRSLCERYELSGIYVPTATPLSLPPCPECLGALSRIDVDGGVP